VLVNQLPGFFQQWLADFVELTISGIQSNYFGRDGTNFGFYAQLTLSITLAKFDNPFSLLPETYNYPIPFKPILEQRPGHPSFEQLHHIHYHRWFQRPGFLAHITNKEERLSDQYMWLHERLPLTPVIDDDFKC